MRRFVSLINNPMNPFVPRVYTREFPSSRWQGSIPMARWQYRSKVWQHQHGALAKRQLKTTPLVTAWSAKPVSQTDEKSGNLPRITRPRFACEQNKAAPSKLLARSYASSPADCPPIDLPSTDKKWQERWEQRPISERFLGQDAEGAKRKAYILPMFPYPSGNLHMGHLRVYTISDVLSRWKHMLGCKVFNPMGWDAFGLPAENAAVERGVDPATWTRDNIATMRKLLKAMNTDFMWSRELSTCDPMFYKHTQRLFLLFLEHGLAYRDEGLVNWDPVDKTVLANEQVDKDGRSWRSGAKVEQKNLTQWFLKVTEFQDALLRDLDLLSRDGRWPENVLAMQRNWLGRSTGAKFTFTLKNNNGATLKRDAVEVFSTRPDTIFGVQFLALSTSHPAVVERLSTNAKLRAFVETAATLPETSKEGFLLTDLFAVNPAANLSGLPDAIHDPIPVFVAPYVLQGYGEGAVMGVPGHDVRDSAFWEANAPGEPARHVVLPLIGSTPRTDEFQPFTELGRLSEHCGSFSLLSSKAAGEQVVEQLQNLGIACKTEVWRLKDWLISRQRSWGTPIPIIHCKSCGPVPVPDEQLPVRLPDLDGEWYKNKMGNPLKHAKGWLHVPCPRCNEPSTRETDTMDTFVDSSWYFMRFVDLKNGNSLFSREAANSFLPVDIYVGGVEHAILHLLYARFVSKFLTNIGLWPDGRKDAIGGEPFSTLISQGMVHGKTHVEPSSGRFLRPDELDLTEPSKPRIKASGLTPATSYQKMSKSKHNGVNPSECIDMFGADVVRAHVLFAAPVTDILDWDDTKIIGIQRWLGRLWRHVARLQSQTSGTSLAQAIIKPSALNTGQQEIWSETQQLLSSIWQSYETTSLNTLVSDLMKLTQHVIKHCDSGPVLNYHQTSDLLRALAPVAPAFAGECWESLHTTQAQPGQSLSMDIFDEPFPTLELQEGLQKISLKCAVQENGKFRFAVDLPVIPPRFRGDRKEWVLHELGKTQPGSLWYKKSSGRRWKRVIVIKDGKTINFVD